MRQGFCRAKILACTLFAFWVRNEAPASAQSTSLQIEDLTWPEVQSAIAAGKTTAIYLAGSTEEGGPHMALGKHTVIARFVAQQVAEALGNALVYPTLPFAPTGDPLKKTGLMEFPGTIDIPDDTFGAVARGVALSAISAGFQNVILMGEHGGGQKALEKVAAQLESRWSRRGIHIYYADGAEADLQIVQYCKDHGLPPSGHAGIQDTPKLMFLDTEGRWIRKAKLAPGGEWKKTGVDGDPTQSSAELGKIFLTFEVQALVAQIRGLMAAVQPHRQL